MNVLIGSPTDSVLERLGIELTDLGWTPFFCDDADVLVTSLRDQSVKVQMIVLDATIAPTDLSKLVADIRDNQVDTYPYLVILHPQEFTTVIANKLRIQGADTVLAMDVDRDVFRSHLHASKRIVDHQLKQQMLQQSLWNQANHDPLTEISNRRSILRSMERQATLSHQRQNALGLLMMDLDFFKNVNDTYGHDCGDTVLREVASRLKQCIRNSDAVGRFGGEEFLAIIPNCSGEELTRLAERIRQSAERPVSYKQLLIPISMSIGAAVHFQSDTNVLDSLKRADQALYVAKEMGRNRVVCAWVLDEYTAKIG